jgi:hypothetical protein
VCFLFLLDVKRDGNAHGCKFCTEVPEDVWDGDNIQVPTFFPVVQYILRRYSGDDVGSGHLLQCLACNKSLALSFFVLLGRSTTHSAIFTARTCRFDGTEWTNGLFSERDVLVAE